MSKLNSGLLTFVCVLCLVFSGLSFVIDIPDKPTVEIPIQAFYQNMVLTYGK